MTEIDDNGLEARQVALDLFVQIYRKRNPMDQVLQRSEALQSLELRDRAFVRLMLATLFRRLGQIDYVIEHFLDNASGLKSAVVMDILRFGTMQLLYLKTPPHAAVHLSVELAEKHNGLSRYKGLINAILRKVSQQGQEKLSQTSLSCNVPSWLLEDWVRDYGEETALKIVKANAVEPSLDLSVKQNPEEWAEKIEAQLLPTKTLRVQNGGQIQTIEGFDQGAWWVQDLASSLPVKVMGDVSGKSVFDICAAPGGKTAQLLARGAQVVAVDRSPKRMVRFEENMKRLGFDNFKTVIADASVWDVKERADYVLVDAPCSATGTIRRHPDMPYQKHPQDIEKLQATQRRILDQATTMLKEGGNIIYCTCSLQKCEGEDQIDWFLKEHPDFELNPIQLDEIPELITKEGYIRALPFHLGEKGGMDGFFVARLMKKA